MPKMHYVKQERKIKNGKTLKLSVMSRDYPLVVFEWQWFNDVWVDLLVTGVIQNLTFREKNFVLALVGVNFNGSAKPETIEAFLAEHNVVAG